MQKVTVFLCVVLLFFGVTAVVDAAPKYYTYQGSLLRITTGHGGTPEYITDQGISVGDEFTFIFAIDYSRPGQHTRNNGEVTLFPGRVYADLIYSSKHFGPLNPEYDTEEGIAELNHLGITEYPEGWRSDGYTGPGGAYVHIHHDGYYPTPIYEWEIGQEFRVTFTVVDFLSGGSAAGYTRGNLIDISDTNPLEPAISGCIKIYGAGREGLEVKLHQKKLNDTTMTDSEGCFQFQDLLDPAGKFDIEVKSPKVEAP